MARDRVAAVVERGGMGTETLLILGSSAKRRKLIAEAAELCQRAGRRTVTVDCDAGSAERSGRTLVAALAGPGRSDTDQDSAHGTPITELVPLVRRAARHTPVAVLVDGLDRADPSFRAALAALARRLVAERVLLLLGATGPLDPALFDAPVETLVLPPATNRAGAEGSRRPVRQRSSAGDPLLDLPEATRRLLLLAALGDGADVDTMLVAAGDGVTLIDWAPAEELGLIGVTAERCTFWDPAVRRTVLAGASAAQRRAAHDALAAALPPGSPLAAWHHALAVTGRDESAAALLEAAAGTIARRTEYTHAADMLARAAHISPAAESSARRLVLAARFAAKGGHARWSRRLAERVAELTADPDLRGMAIAGGGYQAISEPGLPAVGGLLDDLLDAGLTDRGTALALLSAAAFAAVTDGDFGGRRALGVSIERVHQLTTRTALSDPAFAEPVAPAVLGWARAVADTAAWRAGEGREFRSSPLLATLDGDVELTRAAAIGATAWLAEEPDVAVSHLRRVLDFERSVRSEDAKNALFPLLVDAAASLGLWAEARSAAREGASIAAVAGRPHLRWMLELQTVPMLVAAGQWDEADEVLRWSAEAETGSAALRCLRRRAAGVLAAARGDHETAYIMLRALFRDDGVPLHTVWSSRGVGDLAESAVRAGRAAEAARLLGDYRAVLPASLGPGTRLVHLRVDALLDPDAPADRLFAAAVHDPAATRRPYEQARTRLLYAEWLRARRRTDAARRQLAAALDTFQQLGAAHDVRRVRAELRAAGVAQPAQEEGLFGALTAQQQAISRLAGAGLSNQQIGDRLALSARTVGTHLHRIYPRLGVAGRAQLAELIPGERAGARPEPSTGGALPSRAAPARPQPDPAAVTLAGRAAAVQLLLAALFTGDERPGPARLALVRGEPGAGRSALLRALAGQVPRSTLVVRCGGVAAERTVAGARVREILADLPPQPRPRRSADAAARVAEAVTAAATVQPVLLLLDDVHLFDTVSAAAVGRLPAVRARHRVAIVLTARTGQALPWLPEPAVDLPLEPLDGAAALKMLLRQPWAPAGAARWEVLERADGNPHAITELCAAYTATPDDGVPDTRHIRQLRATAVAAMAPATLDAARRVAAQFLAGARFVTDYDAAHLERAVQAGVIRLQDAGATQPARVRLADPLLAWAVHDALPAAQRRRLHEQLAARPGIRGEVQARHRALAATGPDSELADALDRAAADEASHRAPAAIAWLYQRAAELSSHPDPAAVRLLRAMDAARVAGDTAWMRQLHTTVATTTWDPAVRTATGAITASAMSRAGLQRRAMDVIVRVMRELPTDDHRRALVLAGAAALVAQSSGLGEHRRRLADLLTYVQTRPVDRTDPARRSLVGELPWDDLLTLVRVTHDPYYRAPVGPDPHPVAAEPTALVVRAAIREARGELAPAVELRWAAFLRSRGRGRLAADPEVWPALADGLLGVGRWADAEAVLEAATAAGAGDGLPLMQQELLSVRALLLAYRGEGEAARALVDQAWSVLDLAENRRLQARLVRAAGVAALARGDYSEAYRRHRLLFERDADPPLAELASASLIELVGSAVRAERTAEVDALLVEIPRYRRLEVGHGARHPAAVRTASASLSLLSAAADGTLPGLWPLERALAQLHHGELLRRQRQRAAARVPLRAALEFFDRLGARVLADAARAELGATGGGLSGAGAARHSPAALELPLTPQQREVALLAAEGLRNREIAERLMVSPRTVGAHLQATYARLGITSRRQLRAAITGHDYALLGASEPS